MCAVSELKQVRDWEKCPVEFCCQRMNSCTAANGQLEKPMQIHKSSLKPTVSYTTSGSKHTAVTRDQSGWGFTVKKSGRTVDKHSGAYRVTTSSLTMKVEAVTQATQWLASQYDTQTIHDYILNEPSAKGTKPCTVFGCKDSCGSTAWACGSYWKWKGR